MVFTPRTPGTGTPKTRFSSDDAQFGIANLVSNASGLVTERALLQYALEHPAESDVVKNMLATLRPGSAKDGRGRDVTQVQIEHLANRGALSPEQRKEVDRVMGVVRTQIVGQEHVLEQVQLLVEHIIRNKD